MYESSFAKEINMYIELRSSCMSYKTVILDKAVLLDFDKYLTRNKIVSHTLDEEILTDLINTFSGKSQTRQSKIGVIRSFTKYLKMLGYQVFIPSSIRVKSDYIPYIFSEEEIKKILAYADNIPVSARGTGFLHLKIPMALRILSSCGTRLGETMALKRKDIDFKNSTIFLRETKFSKERCIPIHESLLLILEKYCLAIGIMNKPDAFLFSGKDENSHYAGRNLSYHFSEILKKLNIDQIESDSYRRGACIHCLRHFYVLKAIKQLEKANHPIDTNDLILPTYLGHTHMIDTDQYMRFSGVQVPESLQMFESYTHNIIPIVEDFYEEN